MQYLELLPKIQFNEILSSNVILAYLDPGSGSFILQLLIAGLAGLLFTFRGYWSRVVNWIMRRPTEDDSENTDLDESGE